MKKLRLLSYALTSAALVCFADVSAKPVVKTASPEAVLMNPSTVSSISKEHQKAFFAYIEAKYGKFFNVKTSIKGAAATEGRFTQADLEKAIFDESDEGSVASINLNSYAANIGSIYDIYATSWNEILNQFFTIGITTAPGLFGAGAPCEQHIKSLYNSTLMKDVILSNTSPGSAAASPEAHNAFSAADEATFIARVNALNNVQLQGVLLALETVGNIMVYDTNLLHNQLSSLANYFQGVSSKDFTKKVPVSISNASYASLNRIEMLNKHKDTLTDQIISHQSKFNDKLRSMIADFAKIYAKILVDNGVYNLEARFKSVDKNSAFVLTQMDEGFLTLLGIKEKKSPYEVTIIDSETKEKSSISSRLSGFVISNAKEVGSLSSIKTSDVEAYFTKIADDLVEYIKSKLGDKELTSDLLRALESFKDELIALALAESSLNDIMQSLMDYISYAGYDESLAEILNSVSPLTFKDDIANIISNAELIYKNEAGEEKTLKIELLSNPFTTISDFDGFMNSLSVEMDPAKYSALRSAVTQFEIRQPYSSSRRVAVSAFAKLMDKYHSSNLNFFGFFGSLDKPKSFSEIQVESAE